MVNHLVKGYLSVCVNFELFEENKNDVFMH